MDVVVASASALGVSLHQLFRHREPSIVSALITISTADAALLALLERLAVVDVLRSKLAAILSGTTVVSLLLSIAIYRLSPWHPLVQYPGPALYKLTKLRTIDASWRGSHFKDMAKLHAEYGPVVRMAPNALSIIDIAAIPEVLGANGLPKDRYYRARHPPGNGPVITLNGTDHAHRRRLWNRGLGNTATEEHTRVAAAGMDRLRVQLDRAADRGSIEDMTKWFRFYGFDFMGGFAFGKDFGLVEAGADNVGVWKILSRFLIAHDIIGHLPWLGWRGAFLPGLVTALFALRNFARRCVQDRLARPATKVDLWYYLGAEDDSDSNTKPLKLEQQAAEGSLALVAGADTSATAMACLLYFLLSHPQYMDRARQEVDAAAANGLAPWTSADGHAGLVWLNACMDESLRLMPIVPTNGSRVVPIGSGGKHIAGQFVPEDTEVFVSPYHMHRDARYFAPETESFRPERWLESERGKWNTQHEAYIPFSAGPAQCVGKQLARIEIILVLSGLLRFYDMRFAEGYNPKTFVEHMEEHIVIDVPPLPVVFKRRALA